MTLSKSDAVRHGVVAALVALVAIGAGCGDDGSTPSAPTAGVTSTSPSSPEPSAGTTSPGASASTVTSTTAPQRTASVPGFGEVAFKVTPAGGDPASAPQFCALLAENEQQRARGLMGRRDLAGYDAMVFRFASDTTGAFYMRNVPVALSIAWFAADGRFVSSTDMAPCPDQEGCPTYAPPEPYRLALEVLKGGLGRLGVAEGSVPTVGGACNRGR